ncbi:MAG: hypothetical protein K6U87_16875 [Firmicutes bacterium]|nr:hypothetical protein [Bacillota bacterium]
MRSQLGWEESEIHQWVCDGRFYGEKGQHLRMG